MRVYAFVEYYPNPFKPYLDAQFAQTVADGHELSIFAFGSWGDAGSRVIADFQLADRTRYLPAAPREVPRWLGPAVGRALARPRRVARAAASHAPTLRRRVVSGVQAALLPAQAPDLCLIHDLGTAARLPAIRSIYPRARIALYYHGGEVAPGIIRDEAEARGALTMPDAVFVNSAHSREQVLARGCPQERVHIVPVGFRLDDFPFVPVRRSADGHPLRLAVVGRLARGKGIEYAIDAIGLLHAEGVGIECTIIGDGDERQQLEMRVQARDLGSVIRFAGTQPHHTVIAILSTVDAVLLPSAPVGNWSETQGCVLQEAMLTGALVVASQTGGVPESVPESMHEFLVPPADPVALAGAIRRLAALSDEERITRARTNRAFCERRYDVRTLNHRLLELAIGLVSPRSA